MADIDVDAFFQRNANHCFAPARPPQSSRIVWSSELGPAEVVADDFALVLDAFNAHVDAIGAEHRSRKFVVDRYGGFGVGHNGGSGRAGYMCGSHIKGIGKTPLVGDVEDEKYSNGTVSVVDGLYEVIVSEALRCFLPYSALPILHVIAWSNCDAAIGDIDENTDALIVRPSFIRPAHFERAVGFVDGSMGRSGQTDHARVRESFLIATEAISAEELAARLLGCTVLYARQFAACFSRRLFIGDLTMSNIALDGRLCDFGGIGIVPSWGNCSYTLSWHPVRYQLATLIERANSLAHHIDIFCKQPKWLKDLHGKVVAQIFPAFDEFFLPGALLQLGLSREDVLTFTSCAADRTRLQVALNIAVEHYQRSRVDMVEVALACDPRWDLVHVWSRNCPPHLAQLRAVLVATLSTAKQRAARELAYVRTQSDQKLFKGAIKRRIADGLAESRGLAHDAATLAIRRLVRDLSSRLVATTD